MTILDGSEIEFGSEEQAVLSLKAQNSQQQPTA